MSIYWQQVQEIARKAQASERDARARVLEEMMQALDDQIARQSRTDGKYWYILDSHTAEQLNLIRRWVESFKEGGE